jgi:hypothetical protein
MQKESASKKRADSDGAVYYTLLIYILEINNKKLLANPDKEFYFQSGFTYPVMPLKQEPGVIVHLSRCECR